MLNKISCLINQKNNVQNKAKEILPSQSVLNDPSCDKIISEYNQSTASTYLSPVLSSPAVNSGKTAPVSIVRSETPTLSEVISTKPSMCLKSNQILTKDITKELQANLNSNYSHIVQRVVRANGTYVEAEIEGVELLFLIDTGATQTIISERVFNWIPVDKRPILQKTTSLTGPSTQPLKQAGTAMFSLALGQLTFFREVIVAEIEDEGLLGADIFQNDPEGPADSLFSKRVIQF